MHPDLPSRIAGILHAADGTWDETSCAYRNQARILIETLGLHDEWGSLEDDDSGVVSDTRDELKEWPGSTVKYRYVTDWIPETIRLQAPVGVDTFRRSQPGCPCSICVPARVPYCNWCGIPHESSCLRK
jgi:hypothetical protein